MMDSSSSRRIVEILVRRNGIPTDIDLESGQVVRALTVAYGLDIHDEFHHITTNANPPGDLPIDFFYTNEIVRISDPDTRRTLYPGQGDR